MTTDTIKVIKKEVPISDEEHFLNVIKKIYQENEMMSNNIENQYDYYCEMREKVVYADYDYKESRVENPIQFFSDMQDFVNDAYFEDYDAQCSKDDIEKIINEYKSSDVYARLNPIVPDEVKTQIKEFSQTIEQLEECITIRRNELTAKEDEIKESQLEEIADEKEVLVKLKSSLHNSLTNYSKGKTIQQVDVVKFIKSMNAFTNVLYDLDNSTEQEFVNLLNMTQDFISSDYYKSITK